MKFSPLQLLSLVLVPLACQGEDLFSVKSSPLYSKFWNVTYFDTYKIAKNLATNSSYLLYQDGTQPPSSELTKHDAVIAIPLKGNVGVTEIPTIPFLELLGVQTQVKAYLGDKSFISSPCFLELIDQGSIIDFTGNASSSTSLAASSINGSSLVTFATVFGDNLGAIDKTVYISQYLEKSNEAVYEWLKFYALFFNLESEANRLCEETTARAKCVKENAATVSTDSPDLPVVMWAYYSTYGKGWSVGTCPNYYCEFASACSATLLPATNGSITAYDANFLTDEEFLQFGKNATYWIYPSFDWNTIYASKESILANFTSVLNKQVFDYQGSGENAWFEERFVEYDVVIQDFCSIVGKYVASPTNHKRVWFRNVFTESVGSLGQCSDPTAPLQSPATQCVQTTVKSTSAATSMQQGVLGVVMSLWLVISGLVMMF